MDAVSEEVFTDDFVFRHFLEALSANLKDRTESAESQEERQEFEAAVKDIGQIEKAFQTVAISSAVLACPDGGVESGFEDVPSQSNAGTRTLEDEHQDCSSSQLPDTSTDLPAEPSISQPPYENGASPVRPPTSSQLSKLVFKWYFAGYTGCKQPERAEEAYSLAVKDAQEKAEQFKLPYLTDLLISWFNTGWQSGIAQSFNQSLKQQEDS